MSRFLQSHTVLIWAVADQWTQWVPRDASCVPCFDRNPHLRRALVREEPPTRAATDTRRHTGRSTTLLAAAVMVILSASDVNVILATPRHAAHAHDSRIRDHAQAGSRHDPMSTQPRNVQDRTP